MEYVGRESCEVSTMYFVAVVCMLVRVCLVFARVTGTLVVAFTASNSFHISSSFVLTPSLHSANLSW